MKRITLAILLWLTIAPAWAGVPCSVPFQLQNGVTADATQVMANYNALIACLGNAAAAGANNDITSLSALSTPITPAQGGTTVFVGGTSSGTNTQVVSSVTPSTFSLTSGRQVLFIVGLGNTGPTTLNVASAGNVNFFRRTQLGISAMVGGELVAGHPAIAEYDGTEFVCITCGPYLVGEIKNFAGSTAPAGWAFIDGSCQVRTTFADLFTVIGTAYDPTGSTCDTAHFALPDGRGRVLAGQDNMGTNGAANRITNAASGCTGTTIGGAGCGSQTHTQTLAELAAHTHAITDPGHTHTLNNATNIASTTGANNQFQSGIAGTSVNISVNSVTTGISINSAGTGNAMPILNPLQIVTKIIKL
jgi:microcystin-dependent protein